LEQSRLLRAGPRHCLRRRRQLPQAFDPGRLQLRHPRGGRRPARRQCFGPRAAVAPRYNRVTARLRRPRYNSAGFFRAFLPRSRIMKRALLLAGMVLCSGALRAEAQVAEPKPSISVSGTAEIRVAPDEVNLRLAVESRDVKLDEAVKQNDARTAAVLK